MRCIENFVTGEPGINELRRQQEDFLWLQSRKGCSVWWVGAMVPFAKQGKNPESMKAGDVHVCNQCYSAPLWAYRSNPSIPRRGSRVHPEVRRKCPFTNRCRSQVVNLNLVVYNYTQSVVNNFPPSRQSRSRIYYCCMYVFRAVVFRGVLHPA